MIHICGYAISHDPAGVFTRMTPIPDPCIAVQNNAIVVPNGMNKVLGMSAFLGTTGAQARFVAPSLRMIAPENITPIYLLIAPTGEHLYTIDPAKYFELVDGEQVEVEENSNPAAAEQHTVLIWLSDKENMPVKGKIRTISFTINSATTAGLWVNGIPLLDEDLPFGEYTIVGMRLEGANIIASRLVVPGMAYRPGVLCTANAQAEGLNQWRFGKLGELAKFHTTRGFTLDILSSTTAAAATRIGYLDIIV
jgi:hypothetical protein